MGAIYLLAQLMMSDTNLCWSSTPLNPSKQKKAPFGYFSSCDNINSNYSKGLAIKDPFLISPTCLISTHESIMSDMHGGVGISI